MTDASLIANSARTSLAGTACAYSLKYVFHLKGKNNHQEVAASKWSILVLTLSLLQELVILKDPLQGCVQAALAEYAEKHPLLYSMRTLARGE